MIMIKRIAILLLLAACLAGTASARDGYHLTFHLSGVKDTMVYIAHYYGKPLPTIYRYDSARIKNGVVMMDSKKKLNGGIYLVLLNNMSTYFEFLLNNGDEMTVTAAVGSLPEGVTFKNSPENERFVAYEKFLKDFGEKQQKLQNDLAHAANSVDTAAYRKTAGEEYKKLTEYRRGYIKQYPGTLLANIFAALEVPQVPEGIHRLPNGLVDSSFAYDFYKAHYWDGFNFRDDRLINTPIYDAKLDEYMNKLVIPYVDSVEKEDDMLLAKTRGTEDLFHYTLWYATRNAEQSKIMGMDEVFVYLVEKYYMKGDAKWLTPDELQKYIKRSQELKPNVMGNIAPDIVMQDVSGKEIPLSSVKAKYTVVAFWEPSCGHCQKEIPLLDSVYKSVLKNKGVKVYSVRTDDPVKQWQEFIQKHDLGDWVNVYDPEHHSDYHSKYDVKSTPTIYVLDENKIIIGKGVDHTNVVSVIENYERKNKSAQARIK